MSYGSGYSKYGSSYSGLSGSNGTGMSSSLYSAPYTSPYSSGIGSGYSSRSGSTSSLSSLGGTQYGTSSYPDRGASQYGTSSLYSSSTPYSSGYSNLVRQHVPRHLVYTVVLCLMLFNYNNNDIDNINNNDV